MGVLIVEWPERAGANLARSARACRSKTRSEAARALDSRGAPGMGGPMASTMIPPEPRPISLPAMAGPDAESCRLPATPASAAISASSRGERRAVLMDAPPPHEDPRPFVAVAEWLDAVGLSAPEIIARDLDRGLLLLGDFGDARMREALDDDPSASASCTSWRPTCWSICTAIRRCRGFRRTGSSNGSRS